MKRLSVIVPMYNVEPYVERCLRSLEDQDIPREDYDIICINDGSPDNCCEVIVRLQKEYDNIILIDQENQGVSRARNNGIINARGKYLMFIDPDDYVDTDSFARILKTIDENEAQVSFLGYTCLNEYGGIHKVILFDGYKNRVYNGIEAYFLSHGDGKTDPDHMVAVLFEKNFFDHYNLHYLPDVPFLEDGEFIARILCLAERCIFDGHSFYQRTTRPGSATGSKLFYSEKATNGFLLAAKNLKKFQHEQNLNERQREFLNLPICKFVVLVVTSAGKPFNLTKIVDLKQKLKESGLSKVDLHSLDKEFTSLGCLYNSSIYVLIIHQFLIYKLHSLRLRLNKFRIG